MTVFFLPLTALCGAFHTSFAVFHVSSLSSALLFPRSSCAESLCRLTGITQKYKPICAMVCIRAHKITMRVHMFTYTYDSINTCRGCAELHVYTYSHFFGMRYLALVICVDEKQIFKPINNGLLRQSLH